MWRFITAFCLVFILQGCTTLKPFSASVLSGEDVACLNWFEDLAATLDDYDFNVPGTARINGFPQLSGNRFLASMTDRTSSNQAFAEWLELLREFDAESKKLAFANLPASVRQQVLTKTPVAGTFDHVLAHCGQRLNNLNLHNPRHKSLLQQVKVPDAYQNWKRIIGFYPLARYIAAVSIDNLHRELSSSFKVAPDSLTRQGELIRYSPSQHSKLPSEHIAAMLSSAYRNSLEIPRLTALQLQQLLAHFAPVWEIDTRNDTDKIGRMGLDNTKQPVIDVNQATVYVSHGYARWQGKVLLQLVYQIWLPAREKTGLLDLYGGPLDSVIWRVTLNPQGVPMAFDSIHGCGCYYVLFPGQGYRAIPPKDHAEPVLSPKSITNTAPDQRLLLRLQSRSHYLQQVSLIDDSLSAVTHNYEFRDLALLHSLAMPNGTKRSLYDEDGLIKASERTERLLFWPYGVASPGAMRQWGVHAIAFIGRRHFDDPFLLENLLDKE
ncbi:MAG: hypothetical protein ABL925_02475 [Methylococcales bacterium]